MEDGDTDKYHPSRVIQDFVFSSWKGGCVRCISFMYIINKHMRADKVHRQWWERVN